MLTEPWWYYAAFIGVVLLIGAFPIAHKWERRQDARDKALWDRISRYIQ